MTSLARLRCKHTSATWYRWTGDDWEVVGHLSGPPLVGLTGTLFQRVVCDCGEWLPLGEANDEGEAVAIEKRAAELAAEIASGARLPQCDNYNPFEDNCERCGWECWIPDAATPKPPWQSGCLARCIATHGDATARKTTGE